MSIEHVYTKLTEKLKQFFVDARAEKAIVALSGGIDSAVVVALAVGALGAKNVRVVLLPSPFSSDHSIDDSIEMAIRCGVQHDTIHIGGMYELGLGKIREILPEADLGLTSENMQSRLRCVLTMALSNATGALMLNTSNRSEILVGYGTLYGDTSGAVGVIASLYKGEVYDLARYINSVCGDIIPQNIIDKAPSAELRDGQLDSHSLPDYPVLDSILHRLVDLGESPERISRDYSLEIVSRIVSLYEGSAFKRKQLPPML